jgi:16S rRNA (adenine1518-N6/adenine1519-N6)-dimethyltransferase
VLRLTVRKQPAVMPRDEEFFFRTVRAAFALRRKTLVNSLSASFAGQITKEELKGLVEACGLPENIRGERLDLSAFAGLSDVLWSFVQGR